MHADRVARAVQQRRSAAPATRPLAQLLPLHPAVLPTHLSGISQVRYTPTLNRHAWASNPPTTLPGGITKLGKNHSGGFPVPGEQVHLRPQLETSGPGLSVTARITPVSPLSPSASQPKDQQPPNSLPANQPTRVSLAASPTGGHAAPHPVRTRCTCHNHDTALCLF